MVLPMSGGDQAMRALGDQLPVPLFEETAWTVPPPLSQATVAICTSAALHREGHEHFTPTDTSFRVIERAERDLVLGHWSPNFDRTGFTIDLDVVYPIDRLEDLAATGKIGAVAPRHIAFAGNQPDDVATVRLDTGPAAAAVLRRDGVDVVVLTPV